MEILKFSPMLGLGWRDENAGVEFVKESRGRSKEFSNRYAAASVILIFLQNIVPRLEAADFVYKYSWFITRYKEDIVLTEHKDEDDWDLGLGKRRRDTLRKKLIRLRNISLPDEMTPR